MQAYSGHKLIPYPKPTTFLIKASTRVIQILDHINMFQTKLQTKHAHFLNTPRKKAKHCNLGGKHNKVYQKSG